MKWWLILSAFGWQPMPLSFGNEVLCEEAAIAIIQKMKLKSATYVCVLSESPVRLYK